MNKKRYKKRLGFQQDIIEKQSKQIESLKSQIESLKLQIQEKDEIINSVDSLKKELAQNIAESKKHKEEYKGLVNELRKMKKIIDVKVYKGRWRLVKFLIK